jgi:hypothetical protein
VQLLVNKANCLDFPNDNVKSGPHKSMCISYRGMVILLVLDLGVGFFACHHIKII